MAIGTSYDFWPDWMPAPQDSFSFQPEDLRETTETEVGAIVRPQFKTDVLVADCTLVLDRMQAAWFEAFERFANHENFWFHFPIWHGGDLRVGLCMFKDRPKWTVEAFETTYKFNLLIQKRSLEMDQCLLDLLDCWDPCEITSIENAVAKAVSVMNRSTIFAG